jgi:RsiW-degrading membrane proteinase PrsW (M82 family)
MVVGDARANPGEWFVVGPERKPFGPYSIEKLREYVVSGRISRDTLVHRRGTPEWVRASTVPELFPASPSTPPRPTGSGPGAPPPAPEQPLIDRMSRRVAGLTDTEAVDRTHFTGLFREVGRRHSRDDTEAVFAVGLSTTTPGLADVSTSLPAPWVFTRLLSFLGLAFLAMWFGWKQWGNPNLLPGIILLGSFTAPLVAAVFLFECNAPKNISLFAAVRLFVWGGVLGLLVSLLLFSMTERLGEWIGPPIAGVVEEPAKLLAVIALGSLPRYRWTLNGMCLGAAAGAGFAAFESAGYAMNFLLVAGDAEMFNVIALRGMLAPFGHVVWTAIAAGAVWRVKGSRPFDVGMLRDRRCFAPIVAVMALHAVWNSPLPALLPFLLGYLALGAVAWTIAIGMLLGGLREIREAAVAGDSHAMA